MPKQPSKAIKSKKARKAKPLSWVQIDQYLKQPRAMPLSIQHDLEPELESGKRKSMRRDIATGKYEPLSAKFWKGHLIDISTGTAQIYPGGRKEKDDPQRWSFFAHQQGRVDGVYRLHQRRFARATRAAGRERSQSGGRSRNGRSITRTRCSKRTSSAGVGKGRRRRISRNS